MVRSPFFLTVFITGCIASLVLLLIPTYMWPLNLSVLFEKYRWLDDVAHSSLFFSMFMGIQLSVYLSRRKTVVALLFFAIGTELAQESMANDRMASMSDVYADLSGILAGLFIVSMLCRAGKAGFAVCQQR